MAEAQWPAKYWTQVFGTAWGDFVANRADGLVVLNAETLHVMKRAANLASDRISVDRHTLAYHTGDNGKWRLAIVDAKTLDLTPTQIAGDFGTISGDFVFRNAMRIADGHGVMTEYDATGREVRTIDLGCKGASGVVLSTGIVTTDCHGLTSFGLDGKLRLKNAGRRYVQDGIC